MHKLKNSLLPCLIISAISFPFLIFFFKVRHFDLPEFSTIGSCLIFTFTQAGLSVLVSWTLAVPAALGLLSFFKKPIYSVLEWIYLTPLFLPPLVIAGGMMNILEYFHKTPFGLTILVLGHSLTYAGGMAVILARLLMAKTSHYCEWAVVHGASRLKLIPTLLRFVLKRDLQLISLTVFCFCLTSFSLPLLLGGVQNKTLEVLIYEYLKTPQDWPIALGLLSIEILFIFILSFFILKPRSFLNPLKPLPYIHFKLWVTVGLIPVVFIFTGLFEGLFYIPEIFKLKGFFENILSTLFLSLSVGIGVILFLVLISLSHSADYLKKFLMGYGTPSIVLTGFAFLTFAHDFVYFSWIFGLVILFLPALYRWAGESFLSGLKKQIQTAQTLGADMKMIFQKIIWPQSMQSFCLLGGIAGFWAGGDFAYTMITAQGETHLALLAQQLLGRYRTEQGLAVIWIMLFVGSFCFFIFKYLPFLLNKFLKKI